MATRDPEPAAEITLEQVLAASDGGCLTEAAVIDVGLQILSALKELHARGIAHGALKPSDLRMSSDGRVTLPASADDARLGESVAQSDRETALREDLSALGTTMHRLLTGFDPAEHEVGAPLPDIRLLRPEVDDALASIITDALASKIMDAAKFYHRLAVETWDAGCERTLSFRGKLVEVLHDVEELGACVDEELRFLAVEAEVIRFPAGSIMLTQGTRPDSMYVMRRGLAEISVRTEEGKRRAIAHLRAPDLRAPDVAGRAAMFTGEPLNVTWTAETAVEFLRVRRTSFARLIRAHPQAVEHLTEAIAAISTRRKDLRASASFGDDPQRRRLWNRLQQVLDDADGTDEPPIEKPGPSRDSSTGPKSPELHFDNLNVELPPPPPSPSVLSAPAPASRGEKPTASKSIENAQFTVYGPRAVAPNVWTTMLAFAHLAERPPDAPDDEPDPLAEVQRQAEQILGEKASEYALARQDSSQAIPRYGQMRFVPQMAGVEFNPPEHNFVWAESVHRQEFRFRASSALAGQTARGSLAVFFGSILIAEVALSIRVEQDAGRVPPREPAEPLRANAYRKIFASYSRRDAAIVNHFERFAASFGDRYLRDIRDIRAGEVWSDRLEEMIREANIFQLFWSSNSMQSPFVRQEWEYALTLRRPNFIKPTYWENPLPESPPEGLPPEALRRLHFYRIGGLLDSAGDGLTGSSEIFGSRKRNDELSLRRRESARAARTEYQKTGNPAVGTASGQLPDRDEDSRSTMASPPRVSRGESLSLSTMIALLVAISLAIYLLAHILFALF